jgi:hypothetical protein
MVPIGEMNERADSGKEEEHEYETESSRFYDNSPNRACHFGRTKAEN